MHRSIIVQTFRSRHADFAVRRFNSPLILIKFSTTDYFPNDKNGAIPRFTLFYKGCGPNVVNPPTFTHFYREKIFGETEVVTYPEGGGLYPPNQIVTYLGLRKDRAILRHGEIEWQVKVSHLS